MLKIFFFPDFLKNNAKGDNPSYVATELVERSKEFMKFKEQGVQEVQGVQGAREQIPKRLNDQSRGL